MIQTTLRLPDSLYKKIKKAAKARGMTLNALILSVLWEFTKIAEK